MNAPKIISGVLRALLCAAFSLLLLGVAARAFAQGSPYDEIGFGVPVRTGNAIQDALGGTGVAMATGETVNDMNPADWTWLTRARFTVSSRFNFYNTTEGNAQDQQFNIFLSGVTFGAPIYAPLRATLALGYVPLTDASDESIVQSAENSDSVVYYSKGGTNLVFGGLAARPVPGVALGARLDFITGDIRHMGEVNFSDTEIVSSTFERDYYYHGLRPTFGLEFIGDSIGSAFSGWTLGASYSLGTNLTATQETIVTPTSSTLDTTLDSSGVGKYPGSFSAGLSYRLSHRYRAEADYFSQNFTSSYVFASAQNASGDPTLGASSRFAFGLERLANISGEYGTSFGFDRWALRLGFSYATLPLYPTVGGGVKEFSLSGGFGIPLSLQSILDLSIVAGQRIPIVSGSSPNETFIRLSADISFSEIWFVPTQRKQ